MSISFRTLVATLTVSLSVLTVGTASAQTTAFTFSAAANAAAAPGTDGFWFTPTQDIWVTGIGYYYGANPDPHAAGIYDYTSQTLLTGSSVTITAASILDGNFRYESVPFIHLASGTGYVVAAYTNASSGVTNAYNPSSVVVSPEIVLNGYQYNYATSLSFPTIVGTPDMFFGPNFQYTTVTPIPEPETYAMLLAGLGLVFSHSLDPKRTSIPFRISRVD